MQIPAMLLLRLLRKWDPVTALQEWCACCTYPVPAHVHEHATAASEGRAQSKGRVKPAYRGSLQPPSVTVRPDAKRAPLPLAMASTTSASVAAVVRVP